MIKGLFPFSKGVFMKKLKTIVQEMIAKGVTVEYYTRKDGGIRITQVGGVRFNAVDSRNSVGNNYLRQIAGQQGIANAQLTARQYQQRTTAHVSSSTLQATSKGFQDFFKQAKKEAAHGKAPIKITWKNTKTTYQKYGEKFARKILENLVAYATNKTNSGHWAKLNEYFDTYAELRGYREKFAPYEHLIEATTTDKLIRHLYEWSEGGISLDELKLILDKTLKRLEEKLNVEQYHEDTKTYWNKSRNIKIIQGK